MTTVLTKPFSFFAGDDWMFRIRMTDQYDQPYNPSAVEVRWLLHNEENEQMALSFATRTLDAALGEVAVWIPHPETGPLPGGPYTYFLRIVCDNIVSTLLTGPIDVTADPWRAPMAGTSAATPVAAVNQSRADITVQLNRHERIERRDTKKAATILPFTKERRPP